MGVVGGGHSHAPGIPRRVQWASNLSPGVPSWVVKLVREGFSPSLRRGDPLTLVVPGYRLFFPMI